MNRQIFLLTAVILCFAASALSQETSSMPSFSPEIKRVAVFKNGYAFTYREGEARTANGWVYTTNAPAGVLGTVWGYTTTPNVRVVQLLAAESEKKEFRRVANLAEFLLANEGSRARLVLSYSDPRTGGIINKTVEGAYEIISPNWNFLANSKISSDPAAYGKIDLNQASLIIKTETGALFVPATQIQSVEILDSPKLEKPTLDKENRLSVKINGANSSNANLGIAALERGIQWLPAYRVEVKGEPVREAKLELEAMLINNMADLNNSEVYFVVGVPHFLFQNEASPLSLNQTFAQVSTNFRRFGNTVSNAVMTQVDASAGISLQERTEVSPTIPDEEKADTFTAEQLFLYKADGIYLKKGERASMRLFSLTVPCSEVFEWTINDSAQSINYVSSDGQPIQVPDLTNRFWYGLRIKNQTGMPLTTAPAISFKEWRPMGQDLLAFTPINGETVLRVTPATEVIGTHRLEEKSRVTEQKLINRRTVTFDLVTLEGAIKVNNVRKQPVEIALTRTVSGQVTTISDNGTMSREGLNLQAINPNSIVKWNLTIPPGEKEIRYTYKVYVQK